MTDPRVDAYIAESAPFARPILRHLRQVVHCAYPDVEETIKWSMPHFVAGGRMLCGMAAFKAHATFGFWHKGMEQVLGPDGVKGESAMGSLGRITKREDLPSEAALARYIRAAVKLNASGAPGRTKGKPKPARPMPPALAEALANDQRAATVFEEFSPSHRRDYIEWISEAKREQTRTKRIATALAWLREGKSRNWKYEAC